MIHDTSVRYRGAGGQYGVSRYAPRARAPRPACKLFSAESRVVSDYPGSSSAVSASRGHGHRHSIPLPEPAHVPQSQHSAP